MLAGELEPARKRLKTSAPPVRFSGRIYYLGALTLLAALTGDDALAGSIDADAIEQAAGGGRAASLVQLAGPFAFRLDRLGRTREARALLERACGTIDYVYDMSLTLGVTALVAPRLAERLRPLVAAAAEPPEDRPHHALLALIDASVARERDDTPAAAERGAEAARRFDEIGWPWLCARAFELAGETARALEIHRRIGAFGEVRRMEQAGLAGAKTPKRGGSVLTDRERELALLIAGGKGNRAAAEALSITEKAVEKYLTSIYAKLGMTSRAQLAAYIAAGRAET